MKTKIKYLPLLYGCLLIIGGVIKTNYSYGQTYCTPSYLNDDCSSGDFIQSFSTTGGVINITNNNSGCSPSNNYSDNTASMQHSGVQGTTVDFSYTNNPGWSEGYKIWVDWNQDGDFDDLGELVHDPSTTSSSSSIVTGNFTIPATAITGTTRLRIRCVFASTTFTSCDQQDFGETEDYGFVVLPLAPPNNAGVDSLVSPNAAGAFCSGTQPVKVRVSNLGNNSLGSVHVDWSVDGVPQAGQSLTFSPAINSISAAKHDTVITLGYVDFPFQTGVKIKAWTSLPNGVTDADSSDDVLDLNVISNMEGVITHITPGDTTICAGASVILDAGQQPAGCIFIWSNGTVTQQTSVSQAGNYNVIVQSLEGCFAYDTVTINALPEMMAGTFGSVNTGNRSLIFTPAGEQNVVSYFWDFGDGDTLRVSSSAPQPHQYAQDGTYAVTLTESNSCDTVSIAKQVYVSTLPAGISGVKSLSASLKIYPNPASDKLIISTLNQLQLQQLAIYNVLGAKVFSRQLQGKQAEISMAGLPAGIYQLRIQTSKGMVHRRLEVLR